MSFVEHYARLVAEDPEALAIEATTRSGLRCLSRAELWLKAGEVASTLAAVGVGRQDVVGVPYGRSVEFATAVLGIWRARAAWVCLDPALPAARRADIAARACVCTTVQFDGDSVHVAAPKGATAGPSARAEPTDLAYVVFTSGSTGRPKGVRIEHRGLVPMLRAQIAAFDLGPSSRFLWTLSASFDASVSDIGVALLAGAKLLIADPLICSDPAQLMDVLRDRQVSFVDLPPSLLAHLDIARVAPTLRTVVIGGESAEVATARRWAERVHLVNVYGPTEATVCTSLERLTPTWKGRTLGQPMAHVRYRIEEGELWIGGDCLARDYAGDAAETARCFVWRDGNRWYRTGDQVERDGDDWIFKGRIDRQVKLGGKRAEPEEIEAALARLGVTSAVVPRTVDQQTTLTAYVQADRGARHPHMPVWAETADVRIWSASLLAQLPVWMLPRHWLVLPILPRMPSGKVDFAALAALPLPPPTPAAVTASADPLERALAELFAAVLGIATVGRDDDFFALGGDSLALLALLGRAELAGLALSAALVRTHSRISALAVALRSRQEPEIRTTAQLLSQLPAGLVGYPPVGLAQSASQRRANTSKPLILLTGATGFLGALVHRELLARGRRVLALVRAPDDGSARRRLAVAAPAIAGDIALPRFGLTDMRWRELAGEVGCIVHLAAQVNLASTLESLSADNVTGTAHVLELAAAAGAPLIHASTLSVFVASNRPDTTFFEDDNAQAPCTIAGGYAQSKWLAEQVVRRAGIDGAMIRYGLLTGDRHTGAFAPRDWLVRFVRSLAAGGVVPEELQTVALAFDATPVDHAAAATCAIIDAPADRLATYHVAGGRPVQVARLVQALRAEGIALRVGSTSECAEASLVLGLARAFDGERFSRHRGLDLFAATGVQFDDARARSLGIVAPEVDDAYLRRCVRWILGDRITNAGSTMP